MRLLLCVSPCRCRRSVWPRKKRIFTTPYWAHFTLEGRRRGLALGATAAALHGAFLFDIKRRLRRGGSIIYLFFSFHFIMEKERKKERRRRRRHQSWACRSNQQQLQIIFFLGGGDESKDIPTVFLLLLSCFQQQYPLTLSREDMDFLFHFKL